MSWKNVTPMEEIIRFVILAQSAGFMMSELCEQFGISRKTGYGNFKNSVAANVSSRCSISRYFDRRRFMSATLFINKPYH
jgi:hypothetical protein